MRPNRPATRSPADYENLGKAFEGIAGALHEGHPLEAEDVTRACRLAHELWPVRGGGKEWTARQFEDARQECLRWLAQAADGDIRACIELEKACHHIGMALRLKGRDLEHAPASTPRPWSGASEARAAIRALDHLYARYTLRPLALPM